MHIVKEPPLFLVWICDFSVLLLVSVAIAGISFALFLYQYI